MRHRWTRPLWQDGRVHYAKDGNDDPAWWRMNSTDDDPGAYYENISWEYDDREEMGR